MKKQYVFIKDYTFNGLKKDITSLQQHTNTKPRTVERKGLTGVYNVKRHS